jgi:hypothetical protein
MTNTLLAIATNALLMWSGPGITETNDNYYRLFYASMTNTLCSASNDTTIAVNLDHGGRLEAPAETVSTVTNVVTADNSKGCATCDMLARAALAGQMLALYHPYHDAPPYEPATERTETTEIIEIRTLRFHWDGQDEVVEHRRVLESKVRKWVKRDEWVERKGEK